MAGRGGFIRRVGWGVTPGGRGFFSHRGPHMPHGGGGLFRVITLPLRIAMRLASSLLRLAALLKHHKKKGIHRAHHARVKKGRKPKIHRGPHPHGIKRPVTQRPGTPGGRTPKRPGVTFLTGVFNVRTGTLQRKRLL